MNQWFKRNNTEGLFDLTEKWTGASTRMIRLLSLLFISLWYNSVLNNKKGHCSYNGNLGTKNINNLKMWHFHISNEFRSPEVYPMRSVSNLRTTLFKQEMALRAHDNGTKNNHLLQFVAHRHFGNLKKKNVLWVICIDDRHEMMNLWL